MKTYKQLNNELRNRICKLETILYKVSTENNLREKVIVDHNLFDPVKYQELYKKLAITVDTLESIRNIELHTRMQKDPSQNPFAQYNKSVIEIMCCTALDRIKEEILLTGDLS